MMQTYAEKPDWAKRFRRLNRYSPLFLLMAPGLLYLFINNYLPMFGVVIAFKEINYAKGIFGSDWIGFANFEYLFRTKDAWVITRNTLLYNLTFITINTVAAVGIGVLLNEIRNRFFSRLYQSVILLPYLISMVVVGYVVLAFLNVQNGMVNNLLLKLGADPIMWYSESKYWPYILIVTNTWKNIGYFCLIYLASIVSIDQEYYEAATVDGASRLQQIFKITIPMIMPVIIIMTLLSIGKIFYADFGLFYQVPLNSGPLQSTTDVIDTYVYRSLINLGDIGMSSAAGLYQSLLGFLLVLLSNLIVRKKDPNSALF